MKSHTPLPTPPTPSQAPSPLFTPATEPNTATAPNANPAKAKAPASLTTSPRIRFRAPKAPDAQHIHQLIKACPPLDLNSCYAYLLQTTHHAHTCVIAEHEDTLIGYVSGYRLPHSAQTLFIWQVAVHPRWRGHNLGGRMINEVLKRSHCHDIRSIETTVSPDNLASENLFRKLAGQHGAECNTEQFFGNELFSDASHEPEHLFRISPLHLHARFGNQHPSTERSGTHSQALRQAHGPVNEAI
ncbi:L-2,4-diaminobutyric acid acetyltransferase [gamma proteobacterium HdN1]|nr:L-2,4-diaminobutyric acid acetyltransferase [gamma proteobacterium HdN1]